MKRRQATRLSLGLLALAAGSLLSGRTVAAAGSVRRIAVLTTAPRPTARETVLRQQLTALGWQEGKNLAIDYRRVSNDNARLAAMARELAAARVDVIVASTTPALVAAREATRTIPIVTISADPVGNGFVSSLHRSGGNLTGISIMSPALVGKRLELLREVRPGLRRVALLAYQPDPSHRLFIAEFLAAGQALSLQTQVALVEGRDDLDRTLSALRRERPEGLVLQPLFHIMGLTSRILDVALALRMPTITDADGFVDEGGLLYYGHDPVSAHQRLAVYVDRVLRGADPAELPVEQPQRFLLAANLRTARTLGITLPPTILMRADKVVE